MGCQGIFFCLFMVLSDSFSDGGHPLAEPSQPFSSGQLGMKFDSIRSESEVLHASPFNSEKKRGGVALRKVKWSTDSCFLLLNEGADRLS